ncbi:unnamed protein product [Rotaria sp. Silwood1]|nr:unnamed protein product [Rotaria sp. Silwood1]CAF1604283.1 unnamed protein product [Rotaria sp. Silwood1]CAF3695327.1 unnamed protein product [Rotaria sp. Silwood1]CAF3786577.1 unnamed protein product [Rotaria sp. Silwood1]CAF4755975.1 unnamed protein product [Rotaria sp. Silwood1]
MTIDSKLETSTSNLFSTLSGEDEKDFQQWKETMSIEIRMPGGLSTEKRQKLWISLASKYIHDIHLDWDKTLQFAFNNNSYSEDEQLNIQIDKDLHRTGCNWSSNESNRAILKRVLLAFARYNKTIGYCQGLHILTSVILDVINMNEEYALMILIYLIDCILPDFFSNNLHALAIDMIVFDQWLKIFNPQLHLHLQNLQTSSSSSNDDSEITYEPPLLNVFTIQWFLTLFATCLPRQTTLRIWDILMIEGSEVLFRTGLLLWSKLAIAVLKITTADQFYSVMGHLSVQLLDEKILVADNLIQGIYNFGPFPTPFLSELREKFTFKQSLENIKINQTNTNQSKSKDIKRSKAKLIDDDVVNFISCFAILSSASLRNNRLESILPKTNSPDINQLREQYKKLKQRNQQVQIITQCSNEQQQHSSESVCSISGGPLINHLLVKPTSIKRNQLKKNFSMKSSSKEESEDIQNEFEQLLTCLNFEKPTILQSEQNDRTSKNLIDHLIKSRSSQIPKYSSFNPFPSRSFNENVAVNGYKLGLYSPVVTSR